MRLIPRPSSWSMGGIVVKMVAPTIWGICHWVWMAFRNTCYPALFVRYNPLMLPVSRTSKSESRNRSRTTPCRSWNGKTSAPCDTL